MPTTQSGQYDGTLLSKTSASEAFVGITKEAIIVPTPEEPAITPATPTLDPGEEILALLADFPRASSTTSSYASPAAASTSNNANLTQEEIRENKIKQEDLKYNIFKTAPFMELFGLNPIELSFYEPDASTFRSNFYYNTRLNRLYMKIVTTDIPYWKQVS